MSQSLIHENVQFNRGVASRLGVKTLADLAMTYMAQRVYTGSQAVLVQHPNKLFSGIMAPNGDAIHDRQYIVHAARQKFGKYVEQFMPIVLFGYLHPIDSGPRRGTDQLVVTDMVLGPEYEEGICDRPCSERLDRVNMYLRDRSSTDYIRAAQFYDPGTYGDPQALADMHGGIVLRDPGGSWISGRGRGGQNIYIPSVTTEPCKQG